MSKNLGGSRPAGFISSHHCGARPCVGPGDAKSLKHCPSGILMIPQGSPCLAERVETQKEDYNLRRHMQREGMSLGLRKTE